LGIFYFYGFFNLMGRRRIWLVIPIPDPSSRTWSGIQVPATPCNNLIQAAVDPEFVWGWNDGGNAFYDCLKI
jgi:hypothetical protein